MLAGILIIILLVLLNGFFVAAEFAIVKVRVSQIELKIKEGSKKAIMAEHITDNLNAYLSATQLGITMASLALGWFGEETAAEIVHWFFSVVQVDISEEFINQIALALSFIFITFIHITFGELAPKAIAIQAPEATTFAIAWPLRIFYNVFRPLIWVFNSIANSIIRMIGFNPMQEEEMHSTEELKIIIEKGVESGAIDNDDHQLIENVFHFNETTAKQIMVSRTKVVALEVSSPDKDILEKLDADGYSRMPVYKETLDDVIGIVHTKDILAMVLKGETIILKNILRPAYLIPETKNIGDLLKDFQRKRVHMAIVVDEFGGTSGIVTMEDVIEELVGEIQDEYDEEKPIVEVLEPGVFMVNGMAPIKDVNEYLNYPLAEGEEFETVAGLMNYIFDKIPEQNEVQESGGYRFTIIKNSKKSVELVKLEEILKADD